MTWIHNILPYFSVINTFRNNLVLTFGNNHGFSFEYFLYIYGIFSIKMIHFDLWFSLVIYFKTTKNCLNCICFTGKVDSQIYLNLSTLSMGLIKQINLN